MATFTVNVAENINVWGGEPTSKYGTAVYGDYVYGFGTEDLIVTVFLDNDDTVSLSDDWSIVATFGRTISESLNVDGQMSSQEKFDGAGYNHVFVKPTVDAEERSLTQFSAVDGPSDGFSEVSNPSDSWTEE